MSTEVILSLLEEIKESIVLINQRSADIESPNDFLKDSEGLTKLDAIAMRLQVIGEAVKKIEKKDLGFLEKYTEVEWKKIKGMRDFISHQYSELDEVEVFTACKFDIPLLETTIDIIIKDINNMGII
ncbi:MAG: HepT-like ribonuclease domain-containing protein [Ignavibacteriaceae bacterium]